MSETTPDDLKAFLAPRNDEELVGLLNDAALGEEVSFSGLTGFCSRCGERGEISDGAGLCVRCNDVMEIVGQLYTANQLLSELVKLQRLDNLRAQSFATALGHEPTNPWDE